MANPIMESKTHPTIDGSENPDVNTKAATIIIRAKKYVVTGTHRNLLLTLHPKIAASPHATMHGRQLIASNDRDTPEI